MRVYFTINTIRKPQNAILIIKAPRILGAPGPEEIEVLAGASRLDRRMVASTVLEQEFNNYSPLRFPIGSRGLGFRKFRVITHLGSL